MVRVTNTGGCRGVFNKKSLVVEELNLIIIKTTKVPTELRDALLSIIQTARKVGIPIYKHIHDRISAIYKETSLAERIRIQTI